MSEDKYTLEDLERDVARSRMSSQKAKAMIVEMRDLFDSLLSPTISDGERVKVVNTLRRLYSDRWNSFDGFAVFSKIASCGIIDP
jgi:hypothetical protein